MSIKRFAFEDFEIDPIKRLLLKQGSAVSLNSKTFDLLIVFLESEGEILTKGDLLNRVWPDQFVEESNLPVHISTLRKALNEKKGEHRFIVTVPGKGYRFVASIATDRDDAEAATRFPIGRVIALVAGLLLFSLLGTAIFLSSSQTSPSDKPATLNRLTVSGKVTAATISPDGRNVVFALEESGGQSLWRREMESGDQKQLRSVDKVEFVGLSVSPDNSFVYFSVFSKNQAGTPLRRISISDGAEISIDNIDTDVSVSVSPDGDRLAYTRHSSSTGESYLAKAKNDGTEERVLATAKAPRAFETFKSNPVAWAPSGRDIASAVVSEIDGVRRSGIELFDAESGAARELVPPKFAFLENIVWIDSDRLAFIGYEKDEWSSQVFTVEIETREIRKLTNDLQNYSWLAYANRNLITVQRSSKSTLNKARLTEAGSPSVKSIMSENGSMWAAAAPDGSILYTSTASGQREIWRIGPDSGGPERLTTNAHVTYGLSASFADGSIAFSSDREGKNSIWLADSSGQNIRRLTSDEDIAPQFSADGKTLAFQSGSGANSKIRAFEITSDISFWATHTYSLKPTLSPDGMSAAYYFMDPQAEGEWRIGVVRIGTGDPVKRIRFPFPVNDRRMAWHPSGKFIGQAYSSNERAALLILPLDDTPPRLVEGLGEGEIISISWMPGGEEFAYSLSTETRDVITISNF